MAELARVAKVPGSTHMSEDDAAQAFIAWLAELKRELGIPRSLAAYRGERAVTRADVPALVDIAVNDICHRTNPRPCAREDFERIFREALS